jgi:hypothetical protein
LRTRIVYAIVVVDLNAAAATQITTRLIVQSGSFHPDRRYDRG